MKYEEFPPGKISFGESARLNLSLHYSKVDLKKRFLNLSPDLKKCLRQEWGDYINNSYPFKEGHAEPVSYTHLTLPTINWV